MLKILMMDSDYYQALGLSYLILNQPISEPLDICFLLPSDDKNIDVANVVFRRDMVTINIFNDKLNPENRTPGARRREKITLHVPFLSKGYTMSDISIRIKKILSIASVEYSALRTKEDAYCSLGLKKYAQLSETEYDVMLLIGRGYSSEDISKILNRSRKTISTHYRNASRKMGMANRAEFYRYASFVAKCGRDERNTFCL